MELSALIRNFWLCHCLARSLFVLLLFGHCAFSADPDVETLMRNGHWKRARDLVGASYRSHPNDARSAYLMARVSGAFKDFEVEFRYAEIAVRLDPKTSAYHRELGLARMHAVEKSSMLKAIGMMRRARAELDASLAIAPNDLDERRLQQAADLLTVSDMQIKEIAHVVGYGHHSSFVRAFQRRFALTPRRYRREKCAAQNAK